MKEYIILNINSKSIGIFDCVKLKKTHALYITCGAYTILGLYKG